MFPSTIKLLGHQYEIIVTEAPFKTNAGGQFDTGQNTITICSTNCEAMQRATLLHEIIEAAGSMMELGLEHEQVSALGEVIYQVLTDNDLSFYHA